MRNVITSADRRRSMNRHYIKARKIKKSFGSEILIFMELLKVDKRIAEALNGSLNKCNDLIVTYVDDIWKVTETKTNDSFYVRNNKNWSCSCGELTNCGLPCSHIMKVMKNKDILMETLFAFYILQYKDFFNYFKF